MTGSIDGYAKYKNNPPGCLRGARGPLTHPTPFPSLSQTDGDKQLSFHPRRHSSLWAQSLIVIKVVRTTCCISCAIFIRIYYIDDLKSLFCPITVLQDSYYDVVKYYIFSYRCGDLRHIKWKIIKKELVE